MALYLGVMLCSVRLLGTGVYGRAYSSLHADTYGQYDRQSYDKRKRIDASAR